MLQNFPILIIFLCIICASFLWLLSIFMNSLLVVTIYKIIIKVFDTDLDKSNRILILSIVIYFGLILFINDFYSTFSFNNPSTQVWLILVAIHAYPIYSLCKNDFLVNRNMIWFK